MDIQEAFEQRHQIQLTQPEVTLSVVNKSPQYVESAAQWLRESLTDRVKLVRLDLNYTPLSNTAEQTLYEIVMAKKGVQIVVNCNEYSVFLDITFSANRSSSKISTEIYISQEDLFEHCTPRIVLDALTCGGTVDLPPNPFRSVILDKESPTAPSVFSGIEWPLYNNAEVSDAYIEVVSKLPDLKIFQLSYERDTSPTEIQKVLQYLSANAHGLKEFNITMPFSPQLVTALDNLVASKKLKTLSISQSYTNIHAFNRDLECELHSLAHNTSIEHLMLNWCVHIRPFLEPLQKNRTISSIALEMTTDEVYNDLERLVQVLAEKKCLRHLSVLSGVSISLNSFLSALQNKNITKLQVNQLDWPDDPQFEAILLENPHLTSLYVKKHNELHNISDNLKNHLESNRNNRNKFQMDCITLLYNIARTNLDPANPNFLPQDVWCHIMSQLDYPGIDLPFGDILRELFKNSSIRRVAFNSEK